MTLNASGPISLGGSTTGQSVNLELGQSATAQISFNDAAVRTLTGTSSGASLIMPTNFYGKSSVTYTFPTSPISVGGTVNSSYGSAGANFGIGYGPDGLASYGIFFPSYSGGYQNLGSWVSPASATTSGGINVYEYYATITSSNGQGSDVGSFNSWVNGAQTWGVSPTSYNVTCTRSFTVQVRKIGTTTVVGTFTVNATSTWTYP